MSASIAASAASKPNLLALSRAEARAIQAYAWPDIWASNLRLEVESQPLSVVGREYQRDILRDESQNIVCPKGAQLGLTTVFLLKSAHAVAKRGWSVLYLLPLKAGSIPFVQGRVDILIDSSPLLRREFKRVDNRNQKVTVNGAKWYIRGTNIESELREVPADVLVLDERDVANEEYLGDAYARLDGSDIQRAYEVSTPKIEGHGVYGDEGWKVSDQMQWWVACPHCGSKQVLSWEDNVMPNLGDSIEECVDSCRCQHCHKPISDTDRANMNATGTWVPANPGAWLRGYHLSQFNSPTKTLAHPKFGILVNWFRGMTDSGKLKDFFNLGLGLPYAAPGDKFTSQLLDSCRADYHEGVIPDGQLCIGIDQGQDVLHVTIRSLRGNRWRLLKTIIVKADGPRKKWQVLDEDVLQAYSGWVAVCDAHPDKEDCEELSRRYSGRFWMGFEKDRPDQEETAKFEKAVWGEPCKVSIDRLAAFDSYIKSFIEQRVLLPKEARELGEMMPGKPYNGFYHQHMQMGRVHQADASDRLVARWVNGPNTKKKPGAQKSGNRPDHWHHSGMFSLIAGMQDAPLTVSPEIGALFEAAGNVIVQ